MFEAKTPPLLAEKKWEAAATRLSYAHGRRAPSRQNGLCWASENRATCSPRGFDGFTRT